MNRWYWIAAGLLIGAVGAFLLVQTGDLFAQDGPFGGGEGPGGRGMPPRMPRMGGGGGVAMVTMGTYLYITNGTTLYKVDPVKMKLEGTLELRSEKQGEGPRDRGEGRKGW